MRITYTGEQFFPELTMVSDYMYQKIYTPTVCILLLLLFLMTVDQVGDQIEHLGAKYNNECRAQEKKGFFSLSPNPTLLHLQFLFPCTLDNFMRK